MAHIVERYLEKMVAHDFDAMADCLAENVVRVGPYGDTYTPRGPYVEMLSNLMPSLAGYSMRIDRMIEIEKHKVVLVELTEFVDINGEPLETPEALVFDLDPEGLISHISIYTQTLPKVPPATV